MAKKKTKSKPAKAKSAKAKAKKVKTKKTKTAKKTKAKKVKTKSKPKAKAKKTAAKSKSKTLKKTAKKVVKKTAKKAAPKKKVAKKTSKPTVKKKVVVKKPIAKKTTPIAKSAAVASVAKVAAPVVEKIAVSENHTFVPHYTSLHEGMTAPYFEGVDQNGNLVKSSDLLGKTVILYFYPKDDTPGCTAESCSLRDEFYYLNNNNYSVIGVSADDVESHRRFADKFNLPFPLIADTNRSIINAYDVWGAKQIAGNISDGIVRTTFVIDAEGIIRNVVTKVDTANHAKQLLEL